MEMSVQSLLFFHVADLVVFRNLWLVQTHKLAFSKHKVESHRILENVPFILENKARPESSVVFMYH